MLSFSGCIPLLNFSLITKLMSTPLLSLPANSSPSRFSGNEIINFQYMGELGTTLSATGWDLIESASSEGMSSGLHACFL